jgi:hypothetical protein
MAAYVCGTKDAKIEPPRENLMFDGPDLICEKPMHEMKKYRIKYDLYVLGVRVSSLINLFNILFK